MNFKDWTEREIMAFYNTGKVPASVAKREGAKKAKKKPAKKKVTKKATKKAPAKKAKKKKRTKASEDAHAEADAAAKRYERERGTVTGVREVMRRAARLSPGELKKIPTQTIKDSMEAASRGTRWGAFFSPHDLAPFLYLIDTGHTYKAAIKKLGYAPHLERLFIGYAAFRFGIPHNYAFWDTAEAISPELTGARYKGRAWHKSATKKGGKKAPAKKKAKKKPAKKKVTKKVTKKKVTKKHTKADSTGTSGRVVVVCVNEGGKVRVRVHPQYPGFSHTKNIQFPRHLRFEGCKYMVDDLDDKGTHYRAVGEIVPFEGGLAGTPAPSRPARKKPVSRRTLPYAAPIGGTGPRPVLLAKKWKPGCDPRGWWISEKLDGVRAFWDGVNFYSRAGNLFYAPEWFKQGLPSEPLDGELWIGRGMFQQTVSVVRSQGLSDAWKKVRYLVFDAPDHPGGFEERLAAVRQLVKGAPYAQAVKHYRCKGEGHMHHELTSVETQGGEGLMLREPGSPYEGSRSRTLLKVKTFHDAEAVIEGYYPGKGKHKGVIGGYLVETIKDENVRGGVRFKIGTGLTDAERADPLSVGTVITYRYQELSDSGTPRFASKVRVRSNPWRQWV